ncbi:hypothetical protein NKOR_03995 [Candidatus Nitrosopumilus koreensis AR1]|uniref:Roadblock/LC7 family protein n=1 Tax=Candidatus Nitrosopumilus koreensis AR1 TaxID=1229908 RepID=K0B5F0_9ARCH|nr:MULTISPECIES: DUF6659 family protein [Nitrosopumilus]AFS80689.1 hypothetical protein NKOR_03995 [Candidatus Nitrosopumilus koreensis AR1]
MLKSTFENNSQWESASKYILSFPEIRFVGVIDNMGNLVVGDYKKGVVPMAKLDQYKICMEHALELFMKNDLDGTLGPLDYIVSKRKNIKIITIPVNNYLVLISAETTMKVEPIIDEIIQSLNDIHKTINP